jgi:hypothetical protein
MLVINTLRDVQIAEWMYEELESLKAWMDSNSEWNYLIANKEGDTDICVEGLRLTAECIRERGNAIGHWYNLLSQDYKEYLLSAQMMLVW